jgi:hypothetical protein
LTPRRVSLINIFTIALPSFFIALRNNNTGKTLNFTRDLYTFVAVSALFMIGAGYIGEYLTTKYYGINELDLQMVWLSIVIITSVANFFAVALHKGEKNVKIYLLYGIGLLSIFTFLATSRIDFFLLNWLKIFYEIEYLDSRYWAIVAMIGVAGATLLFFAQKLREKLIAQ